MHGDLLETSWGCTLSMGSVLSRSDCCSLEEARQERMLSAHVSRGKEEWLTTYYLVLHS